MRCFIGFFGLTRSLHHTAPSIRSGFYEPLAGTGLSVVRVGHFNLPSSIDNPRSGEHAITPDRAEAGLLELDLCWIEAQRQAAIDSDLDVAKRYPDPFQDGYRSLGNLCHQLRSLLRLWSLLELAGVTDDDVVLFLRPDLMYLDVCVPSVHLAPLLAGQLDWIVPNWQSWGGLNDRFAFCTGASARLYATRLSRLQDACSAVGAAHSERLLRFIAHDHRLRIGETNFRAIRLRANGGIARNDVPMMQNFLAASQEKPSAL